MFINSLSLAIGFFHEEDMKTFRISLFNLLTLSHVLSVFRNTQPVACGLFGPIVFMTLNVFKIQEPHPSSAPYPLPPPPPQQVFCISPTEIQKLGAVHAIACRFGHEGFIQAT